MDPFKTGQYEGRMPIRKSRPTIGLLCDVLWNQYSCDIWAGVRDAAHELDANLVYFAGGILALPLNYYNQANVIYERVNQEQLDGLVIWTGQLAHLLGAEEVIKFCRRFQPLPMVSIELELKGIPSLVINNYQGMYDLVTHLIEVHHYQRLAYIDYPTRLPITEARYRGYSDALRDHGISLDSNLVTDGSEAAMHPDRKDLTVGGEGIWVLFEKRQLRPQKDVEAVVTVADMTALGALNALRARGIRIPDDVALVGFDDLEEIQYTRPPLTTARQSFYEQGWKATEMLLAQLHGKTVPDRTSLSMPLIIRRSCGCTDPLVMQAAVEAEQASTSSPLFLNKESFAARREEILAGMKQAAPPNCKHSSVEWAEHLLDSFLDDVTGNIPNKFIFLWEKLLYRTLDAECDAMHWHEVLSEWRYRLLPTLSQERRLMAENLWQQARTLLGDVIQREQAYQRLVAAQQTTLLRDISYAMMTTFDIGGLMSVLLEELPKLDIPGCYLALYENPEAPAEWAKLILAYNKEGRIVLPPEGQRIPPGQLLSEDILGHDTLQNLVVAPLYFRNTQIGFAVFEGQQREGRVYELLRQEISSALQGALLVAELQKAYESVEEQVMARTIELQQEIAERRRAEEEIRYLQKFLQNIIDSMPSILVGVDTQGRVTHWNREAEHVTGLTEAEAQGRYLPEVFPRLREHMTWVWQAIQKCLPQRVSKLAIHHEGRTHYTDLTVYPLIANGAEGAVIRLEDATEQVQIEERMIQSEKMMTVGGLAAGMAHEINNPLGVILQGIQNTERRLRLDSPKNQEVAATLGVSLELVRAYAEHRHILHYLHAMQEAGTRAAQIVSNMLNFSHPASSAMMLTDLNQLLDLVVELASSDYDLTNKYDFRQINIVRAYEPSLPKVPCISSEIQQVVLNMLRNAAQALKDSSGTAPPPTIHLTTHREEQAVCIEIADNGPGMDEDTRKRVFEPFYTTKTADGSPGLGLSISYFIVVSHHHGKIFADSVPGKGTTFTIMLPLSEI